MPRFAFDPVLSSPPYQQPYRGGGGGEFRPSEPIQRQLCCLSPKERTLLSFDGQRLVITAHALPLRGTTEQENPQEDVPECVEVSLPEHVKRALERDAALEMLCVESDDVPLAEDSTQVLLPLLCLYNQRAAFLVRASYPKNFSSVAGTVTRGRIVTVDEPFEGELLRPSMSASIVRIRCAPQRRMGYATMCPTGSMALLLCDDGFSYSLVLYHGLSDDRSTSSRMVTRPLEFRAEDVTDASKIKDFCFSQSNGLYLLVSLTVHLLKDTGEVMAASPILFDRTVVPRRCLQNSLDYLNDLLDNVTPGGSEYHQVRAALHYLDFAFSPVGASNCFMARVGHGHAQQNPTLWPVQLQGPVIPAPDLEPDDPLRNGAVAIEPFWSPDLVGVAIARKADQLGIDFAATTPSNILPRTTYESSQDQMLLDESVVELGAVVERLVMDIEKENDAPSSNKDTTVTLTRDPLAPDMIHVLSSRGVFTVTSSALINFSDRIFQKAPPKPLKSNIFPALNVSHGSNRSFVGAVVSRDALLGHAMIARLSDGTLHTADLTMVRSLFEAQGPDAGKDMGEPTLLLEDGPADPVLQSVEKSSPFQDTLQPHLDKVKTGISSSMRKIVGAATKQEDVDPATLAVFLEMKKKCEEDIIVPLKEIRRLCDSKRAELKQIVKAQVTQISALETKRKEITNRANALGERLKKYEAKTKEQASRATMLLQAGQDLSQTLSPAEVEYFKLLESCLDNLKKWEGDYEAVRANADAFVEKADRNELVPAVNLDEEQVDMCHRLLRANDELLLESTKKVEDTKATIQHVMERIGVAPVPSQFDD